MRARHPKLHGLTLALVSALAGMAATPASAAVCTWNTTNGNWAAIVNWTACATGNGNPVGAPGTADTANIGATGVVTVNTAQSILNLNNEGIVDITASSLTLLNGSTNNTGGTINVSSGAVLNQSGSVITGGTINTTDTGVLRVISSSFSNILSNVALNGVLDMTTVANARQRIAGGMVLNGSIDIANGGILSLDSTSVANQTLSGTGTINLNNAAARLAMEGTGVTTLGANIVVRGRGNIGQPNNAVGNNTLVNNGRISADVAGGSLNMVNPAAAGSVVNNGTMDARNGGQLVIISTNVNNAGGQIAALDGSNVLQSDSTITGGTIATTGTGVLRVSSSFSNILSNVALNGVLDMTTVANARQRIAGGMVLNGSINIANGGILSLDSTSVANQTLSGTGTINLNDAAARLAVEGTGVTTLGANIVVRGQGNIGQPNNAVGNNTLVNNGRISADVNAGSLNILVPAASGSFINNGTMDAGNGGQLVISTNVNNAGGQIAALDGSNVLQSGSTITGGTINTAGTGVLRVNSFGSNFLSNVTLNGVLDMSTVANARQRVTGGMVLDGSINIANGGILSLDSTSVANQTLSGTGTINLNDAAARLAVEGTGVTTLGANIVVRGQGNIGQPHLAVGNNTLVNNGRISADVNGGTLNILVPAASGSFINNGTLDARDGGTLLLSTAIGNTAGQITAQAGSIVRQNGVAITGGVLNSVGTGAIQVTSNGNNFLRDVTLSSGSVLDMTSIANSRNRLANTSSINGAINVGNGGILSLDANASTGNNVVVNGSGVINLNDAGARLAIEGLGTTTLGAALTVRGQGNIGQPVIVVGNNVLSNEGRILADGGTLTITAPAAAGRLQGSGTLEANGGTLNLSTGSGSTQGRLVIGATGSLGLGTQNLTLNNDYTNVQAGSGNSFNRRAGVTGSGQILAGGDVAQVISGAGVSGGSTTNATLTIGNMRVGTNTYNVNIGNSGNSGPTLRGAIQTNVNGGDISDGRLGGSGVTAGNYNAGGPGGLGSDQVITFTAASAGALGALSGQAINLRSNFDNIADQRLNIVLASGAAAYNAAVGSTVTPVQVANQRVGGSNTATLVISNTAAAGSFSEDLNASIDSLSGQASATGSVDGRLAGTNNTGTGAISVGVNTAAAGARTGGVTLNYQTTGAVGGVSNGLGTAAAGSQVVTVNGNVYQVAAGAIQTGALNFGTVQVGQNVQQALVVRNTASGAAGFVEDLNATFGATSGTGAGLISGTGSLNGILAGTNSTGGNGSMVVSVNTGAAGNVNGSILVNYSSAGAVAGVGNGLGTLGVGSEGYGVQGTIQTTVNVINQASPLVNNPSINLGSVRVGAAVPTGSVSVTNFATTAPQAALNASMGSTTGAATASGSFNLLNPGATNNGSLVVGLNTATAGNFTGGNAGTATIQFVSDANNVGNCAPNCQLNLLSQTVTVEGKVYTQAVGATPTTALNFGIVRVGDTVSAQNIVINNTAAVTALNDTLAAGVSGVTGPFSSGSGVSGVGAQGSGNVGVALNSTSAGVFTQTALVAFTSQNADMADISAGADANVTITAQVNNLANAVFTLAGGAGSLSQSGNVFTLDYGNLAFGNTFGTIMALENDIAGPADDLRGSFDTSGAAAFSLAGWGPFSALMAGSSIGGLNLTYMANSLGAFTQSIFFNGFSFNASDTSGISQNIQLVLRGNVIGGGGGTVPEPGSLSLVLLAVAAAGWSVRRRSAARAGAVQ